jgi:dynein assembly factor 1
MKELENPKKNYNIREEPRITREYLDKLLALNGNIYYKIYEINELLYLHFKSFKKIENLEYFKNLKVLYLEGNSIEKIEGLDSLVNLTSLFLHENVITKIEGLDKLINLANLNLSDNLIKKIEGIENLQKLSNFLIKRNRIGTNGLDDVKELLKLGKEFNVLDISDNRLSDPNIVDEIFSKIPNLRVLYFTGNSAIKKIPYYRKTLINKIKEIRYIDDKPIFDDERRFALAFGKGGLEGEKQEREKWRKEKKEKEEKHLKECREILEKKWGTNLKKEEPVLTEEEKEKKRYELLENLKKKRNNDIFNEREKKFIPDISKEDMKNWYGKEVEFEENKNNNLDKNIEKNINKEIINENELNNENKNIENVKNNIEINNNEDKPPELEIIKSPLVKLEEEKQKIIDNKKEEINIDNGVKIEIKESNLDELD